MLSNASIDAFDAHLLPDSPAIDVGSNETAPEVDFDGNPRPLDGDMDGTVAVDIGADEFTLLVDSDYDCDVDVADLNYLLSHWLDLSEIPIVVCGIVHCVWIWW